MTSPPVISAPADREYQARYYQERRKRDPQWAAKRARAAAKWKRRTKYHGIKPSTPYVPVISAAAEAREA